MNETLRMQGIRMSFSGVEVLHGVDFAVNKGEIMGLCGENGAGKSTLMKLVAGDLPADAGEIVFKGSPVRRGATPLEMQQLGISMIHQELNLLPELTVAQNIFLRREPRGRAGLINFAKMNDGRRGHPRAARGVDRSEAQGARAEDRPEADGGDRQGHLFNVELLIMDEPTSALTGRETNDPLRPDRQPQRAGHRGGLHLAPAEGAHRRVPQGHRPARRASRGHPRHQGGDRARPRHPDGGPGGAGDARGRLRRRPGRGHARGAGRHRRPVEGRELQGPPGRDPGFQRPDRRGPHRADGGRSSGCASPEAGEVLIDGQARHHQQRPRRHPGGPGLRHRGPQGVRARAVPGHRTRTRTTSPGRRPRASSRGRRRRRPGPGG